MQPIRTSKPATASHAEAFGVADEVAREYFRRRFSDSECHLHADGWRFGTRALESGALLKADEAGAMTQEQIRFHVQDYLRATPLEN